MITVVKAKDVYEIKFRYDPVLIAHVKNIPGRMWNPGGKYWTIPADKLGWFVNELRGTTYEKYVQIISDEDIGKNDTIDPTADIPDIDISNVPYYVKEGAKPYQHQLDFMKFAIDRQMKGDRRGFLLADDMGLAKTNESMNLAIYNQSFYGYKHVLIICCVNSSKYNWKSDIETHTRGKYEAYIMGTRLMKSGRENQSGSSKQKHEDFVTGYKYSDPNAGPLPYFLILNIEALRYKEGKVHSITNDIIAWCNRGDIGMIIIDEIHKNASPGSIQGSQLVNIKKRVILPVTWLPLTGTPIVSRPTDVYLPMLLVGAHRYSSFWAWCREFCIYGGYGDHSIIAYKNIPRLKAILQGNMIRRLKKDVLDLPPKIYYTEYVENTTSQKKLYIRTALSVIHEKDNIIHALNPLTKFLQLRQVNGSPELVDPTLEVNDDYIKHNAKLMRLMELLDDAHERGEKTLVFSNWVEPLRTLYRFVSKRYKTCCFTGTMSAEDREKNKRVFQTNPEYTVMLGTIGAAGTSHTFTAASNVIFYDEPWTPSDKEQAEDRSNRIGTTQSLKVFTLITKDTIDERVHDIIYTKSNISKFIVDGSIDLRNHPELFELLMCDQLK